MKQLFGQLTNRFPKSHGRFPADLFLTSLAVGLSMIGLTTQAQTYTVTEIEVLPGLNTSEPGAINLQGEVTGTDTGGQNESAFLFFNSTEKVEQLGTLGSRAFGVDPEGEVVGDAVVLGPSGLVSHAVFFKDAIPIDLGVLTGQFFSRANGINASRQVVGFAGPTLDSNQSRAFIWTDSTGMLDLGTLGGAYAQAAAINDAGFVTGTSQVSTIPGSATHAFTYQPLSSTEHFTAQMRDLGTLGGNASYGMSINANNHVAGYSTINNVDDRIHAFFHDGQTMKDLGSLANEGLGEDSAALAMNNLDQVVGVNYLPVEGKNEFNQVAFIWTQDITPSGKMTNLNTLIGAEQKNFLLLSAVAINDVGQIAATAYDHDANAIRTVLLTPMNVPPR
jgi:probable HAF family extracellular repeat protein